MNRQARNATFVASIAFGMCFAAPSFAQPKPDSGDVLQSLRPPPPAPRPVTPLQLPLPAKGEPAGPGGAAVPLQRVEFSGNTLFDDNILAVAVGGVAGRQYDLAGLGGLADRVAEFYREKGYPFTRVYLPPQDLSGGVLKIAIVEGRYDRVTVAGDPRLVGGTEAFIRGLRPGDPIAVDRLQRAMMILADQPGIRVTPSLRPGATPGTSDLTAQVEQAARFGGEVGLDNAGSLYTGVLRARASAFANSILSFGDRLLVNAVATDGKLLLGSMDYERPVGGTGWRIGAGVSRTTYALGKEFAALEATGLSNLASLRLEYAAYRSNMANVTLALSVQHKALQDRYRVADTTYERSSNSWPLTLRFDRRDELLGGGVTYGSVAWTQGSLELTGAQLAADAITANKNGAFGKFNLDISRVQNLPGGLIAFGRVAGQSTSRNLDSSERFSLGGVYGVRAFPTGEGNADRGWIAQFELRYPVGSVTPFILYDLGHARINAQPWDASSDLERSVAGAGVGARASWRRSSFEAVAAWQTRGGPGTVEKPDRNPRVWFVFSHPF